MFVHIISTNPLISRPIVSFCLRVSTFVWSGFYLLLSFDHVSFHSLHFSVDKLQNSSCIFTKPRKRNTNKLFEEIYNLYANSMQLPRIYWSNAHCRFHPISLLWIYVPWAVWIYSLVWAIIDFCVRACVYAYVCMCDLIESDGTNASIARNYSWIVFRFLTLCRE